MKQLSPLFKTLIVLFTVALMTACGSEEGGGGMDGTPVVSSPEHAATNFFYALYRKKSVDSMKNYSTPKMKRLLDGYGGVSGVSRNMLNMQFDSVEIEVEKSGSIRESYGNKATITLIFTGKFLGDKKADLRVVKLVKRKGVWLVQKVKDDPYAR